MSLVREYLWYACFEDGHDVMVLAPSFEAAAAHAREARTSEVREYFDMLVRENKVTSLTGGPASWDTFLHGEEQQGKFSLTKLHRSGHAYGRRV